MCNFLTNVLQSLTMSLTVKLSLLAFLAFVSSVVASDNFKFELIERNSLDNLRLKVTFPDNSEDTMMLERFYLNPTEKLNRIEKCRFVGQLESNAKSSIALTGCIGSEDVLITILSSKPFIQKMFLWKLDGDIEEVFEKSKENCLRKWATGQFIVSLTKSQFRF